MTLLPTDVLAALQNVWLRVRQLSVLGDLDALNVRARGRVSGTVHVDNGIGYATVPAQETTASTAYVALATAGPVVTISGYTTAYVDLRATFANNTAADGALMSFQVTNHLTGAVVVAAADANCVGSQNGGTTTLLLGGRVVVTGLSPGVTYDFTALYRAVTGGTATFVNRTMTVTMGDT